MQEHTKERFVMINNDKNNRVVFHNKSQKLGFAPIGSQQESFSPTKSRLEMEPITTTISFINATVWINEKYKNTVTFTMNIPGGELGKDDIKASMSARSGRLRDFGRHEPKDKWYTSAKQNFTDLRDELQEQLGADLQSFYVNKLMVMNRVGPGRQSYKHTAFALAVTLQGHYMGRLLINDQVWDIVFDENPTHNQSLKGAEKNWKWRQVNETE